MSSPAYHRPAPSLPAPSAAVGRAPPFPDPTRSALLGTLLYAGTGLGWIVFSDALLLHVTTSPESYAQIQTWKGALFVAATSLVLFLILQRQFTHRTRVAERLGEAERWLRLHVENTPLALVEWDAHLRVTRWSERAEELFGWSAQEVMGLNWAEWDSIHPDDVSVVNARVERNREAGVRGFVSRNRNLTKAGEVLWCEWYNSWNRDEGGEVRSMLSLVHDVTTEHQAMEEVHRLNRELEVRVHQRTQELAQANADLKAFTYSVSHDLRAPVRAVVGLGGILERRYLEELPAEAAHYLSLILAAGSQMDRLIEGLMDYARLEGADAPTSSVALHEVVSAARDTVTLGMEVDPTSIQIEGTLPDVEGREDLLRRVFQNLLENSVRYRDPSRPLEVRVRSEMGTGSVRVFVTDNGRGIPPEDRTRVFGLFERLHQDPERPGTGLGLSIVKRAVELMRGHVVIMDSESGEGVAVALVLPRPGTLSGNAPS